MAPEAVFRRYRRILKEKRRETRTDNSGTSLGKKTRSPSGRSILSLHGGHLRPHHYNLKASATGFFTRLGKTLVLHKSRRLSKLNSHPLQNAISIAPRVYDCGCMGALTAIDAHTDVLCEFCSSREIDINWARTSIRKPGDVGSIEENSTIEKDSSS